MVVLIDANVILDYITTPKDYLKEIIGNTSGWIYPDVFFYYFITPLLHQMTNKLWESIYKIKWCANLVKSILKEVIITYNNLYKIP